jgi:RNA 3'-terminal phosphate cyclase (ATP)
LRTSLALALVTGKPFHLRNIRAGREKPGLQPQHLMCVQAAAEIGRAVVRGAHLKSKDLVFEPGDVAPGDYYFKIGTAGATSLVLHTIYLPLALAKSASTVVIEGGTHVKASPCYHFLAHTWSAYLRAIGIHIDLSLERTGFYPRGGGSITASIKPCSVIAPFQGISDQPITKATIQCGLAQLPAHISERMLAVAVQRMKELGLECATLTETWPGGPGCMLGIELPTRPAATMFFALGERGKRAEGVAHEAAEQVMRHLDTQPVAVDAHSADQLLLPLALADGPSRFRVAEVTSHLLTNAATIGHFVDRPITIDGEEGDAGVVTVS